MNPTAPDLETLFNRVADGLASDADEQRLAELLRSSAETRRAYLDFMELHAALHWDYVAAVSPEPPQSLQQPGRTGLQAGPENQEHVGKRTVLKTRSTILAAFLAGAIVASIVAVAVIRPFASTTAEADGTRERSQPEFSEPQQQQQQQQPAESIAALLVDEVGAEFAAGRAPDGVRLGAGEYELLKGIVHLRFAQGADVVLAGPARLSVKDSQRIQLRHGKVRVTAPPLAKGFTIATRDADFVDLGTEFGLRVDSDHGTSDLYVFDGQVNVADPRSGDVLLEVTEGQSSRYINGVSGAAPKLQENEFPTPGAIGFQRWQQYSEQLRRDPELLAFFPFRRTSNESVLLNEVAVGRVSRPVHAEDGEVDGPGDPSYAHGRISGARWTTGRWPGKDALLFDRDTDFVERDILGAHKELTIAVWLKIDRLDFGLNAILNSNGYDLGDIHFQLTRQGYPRGGVVINGSYEDSSAGNAVPLGQWVHLASVLSTLSRSQQIYVNGVLARERRWPNEEVLRPGSCRLGNWLPVVGVGPENRAFRGQVDELVLWSRALPAQEIRQLVESGRPELLWTEE